MKLRAKTAAVMTAALLATGLSAEAAAQTWPEAAGKNLLVGTWRGRYGELLRVSGTAVNGVPYRVESVTDDGWTTVVRIVLNSGEKRLAFSFPGGNRNYMMKNDLTTGRFSDAMDYTRKSGFF